MAIITNNKPKHNNIIFKKGLVLESVGIKNGSKLPSAKSSCAFFLERNCMRYIITIIGIKSNAQSKYVCSNLNTFCFYYNDILNQRFLTIYSITKRAKANTANGQNHSLFLVYCFSSIIVFSSLSILP